MLIYSSKLLKLSLTEGGPCMKIAIMTDSNSGITQKEAKELGIYCIPMPFTIDGKEFEVSTFKGLLFTKVNFALDTELIK